VEPVLDGHIGQSEWGFEPGRSLSRSGDAAPDPGQIPSADANDDPPDSIGRLPP